MKVALGFEVLVPMSLFTFYARYWLLRSGAGTEESRPQQSALLQG